MTTDAEMVDCYMCNGSGYKLSNVGSFKECDLCKGTGRIGCSIFLDGNT